MLFAFLVLLAGGPDQAIDPVVKEREPASLRSLPRGIQRDLARRACRVPEYRGGSPPYAKGHFRSSGSADYAVVCHVTSRKEQEIIVYSTVDGVWKGEMIDRSSFDRGPPESGCFEIVDAAHPAAIRAYAREYGPKEVKALPRLDHDGVEIAMCDKGSMIRYFRNGRWVEYHGGD